MKVAFVGKGGAGKSTLCGLFSLYLPTQNQKVLAIDADLNIHLPHLLSIELNKAKAISLPENSRKIREYLIGKNQLIKSPADFYKTTPPGRGSALIQLQSNDFFIENYTEQYGENAYCMIVGTYEKEGIGTSCYHVNLGVFENILSHSPLKKDEWIVADMVAGIDAFSNTLHTQFDSLFLVVEPTLEGVCVFNQYKELAEHAGMYDLITVIGNKVEDESDLKFLQEKVGDKLLGCFSRNLKIKQARQKGEKICLDDLNEAENKLLKKMMLKVVEQQQDESERLKKLYELHLKYVQQDYVVNASGDLSGQIDQSFTFDIAK